MATNHEVGSSNLSGRAILPQHFSVSFRRVIFFATSERSCVERTDNLLARRVYASSRFSLRAIRAKCFLCSHADEAASADRRRDFLSRPDTEVTMSTREEQWTYFSLAYERGYLQRMSGAPEISAACRILRDAPWASDLYPWTSLGVLIISTAQDYPQLLKRRSVRLRGKVDGAIPAHFYKWSGRSAGRVERLVTISEESLRPLVSWVRGGSELGDGEPFLRQGADLIDPDA